MAKNGLEIQCDFSCASVSAELSRLMCEQRNRLAALTCESGGIALAEAYSDLNDALVSRIFELSLAECERDCPDIQRKAATSIAVAAVGGYGRREMSPFSDVDIAFLVDTDLGEDIDLLVKRAFRLLMDTLGRAGLTVGYSYRRVDDVDNLELETQTALLDARCVAGSKALFDVFHAALRNAISPAAFVIGHIGERSGSTTGPDTPFVVEPNVKEGHGGLRDLHTARWVAQITFGVSASAVWSGLRGRGIVLDEELENIRSALEFITRVRNALHVVTGRGQDTLTVERQEEVARLLGLSSERDLVSAYYLAAHRIWRIYHKIADACIQEDLQIEPGMVAKAGRLRIQDTGLLKRDPSALIRAFEHAQSFALKIDGQAADLIVAAAADYKLTPEASHRFLDILGRRGAAAALRSMAELGVLQSIVPHFGEAMYLIPGDAAHHYTVGEHSLRAVEQLEALFADSGDQFSDILSRVQQFEVLFLATLLHDIGKLESRRDHAKSGAFRAMKFAARLGMPPDACAKVEFLVRYHLKMAETARLRDLNQKRTIREFTKVVANPQILDMLLLLTIADQRAVGARHWSQIQQRFLMELHERAFAALRSPNSTGADLDRHRDRVRRELCLANLPGPEVDEHVASLPASYLLNTPPEDLAAHINYVRTARSGTPSVEMKDSRGEEFTQLTVVAHDRPGLLSDIAGVLHALGVNIHAAQVFTRLSFDEIAIDILYVDFEGRRLTEIKKWQLDGELTKVLSGEFTVKELLKRMGKQQIERPEKLGVRVIEHLPDQDTVIEIRGEDRPGLLFYLTRRMSKLGLDIHSARVSTWGHEVRDAFYVTARDGDYSRLSDIGELVSL